MGGARRYGWSLLVLGLALVGLSPARAAELLDRVAAVVNNEVITLAEVHQRAAPILEQINREPAERREIDRKDVLRRALDDLIGEKLMDAELKGMNVDVSDQEVDLAIEDVKKNNNITDAAAFQQALEAQGFSTASYHEFMKKQLAKVKLLQIKVKSKVKVSDEDVRAAYAQLAKADSQDHEIHARHIIVLCKPDAPAAEVEATHQKALELMKEARGGADFAELAKKNSQGAGASSGGDLGWFRRGTLAAEFENVAFALKKGEVSEPVRTKFGWHVIKVEDTRQAAAKPFDEVKDQLRDKLYREAVEHQTTSYIAELRKGAAIDIKIAELKPETAPMKP
jgi:peptidyl-prolyl cis-trans isomerase SurA